MANFTIYLLRDSVRSEDEAIVPGAKAYKVIDGVSDYGTLFVRPNRARSPKWADLFGEYVDRAVLGYVQSTSAVFVISVDGRYFALTFGQGRFLVLPEAYEERFGLVVTLNSIDVDALRSIDKRAFVDDQNSRVQTSQAATALSFGVDIERDLIRGIVGRPSDPKLGRRLAGADSLTVTTDAKVPDLRRLLRRYLKKFQSRDYQANFPWVDQVRQVNSRGQMARHLDALLIGKVAEAWGNRGIVQGCWLAVPDVVDWSVVEGFKFTRSPREGTSSDLHLTGLVQHFPDEEPSLEFLKKHHVVSVDDDQREIDRWPVYRCIHCEIDDDGRSFVLSAGRWFEVDRDFVSAVEEAFLAVPRYGEELPVYKAVHGSEAGYNKAVVAGGGGRWCLMDRKMIPIGGVYDKVEFCDIYGNCELVHVKHYGSSNVLGHLFNQGLISGELLKSHHEFVGLANQQLPHSHALQKDPAGSKMPRDVSKYSIVFAIISQSDKPNLELPFFAKVVLKSVYARLLEWGYGKVSVAKIFCDPEVLYLTKLPSRPKRRRAN